MLLFACMGERAFAQSEVPAELWNEFVIDVKEWSRHNWPNPFPHSEGCSHAG